MGEIATWSAVKTKVGLGKDSNECPTKAELLALSPTGTGENYISLEISNASSYGNNETVQLSDIHKVTYKYTFTVEHPTLSFTALGGVPTPSSANVASTREKILDGVATGTIERVNYAYPALPSWLTLTADLGYRASENTDLSARTFAHILTQQDSGKQLTITCNQVAATQTFEYTFKTQYPGIDFNALGKVSSANNILGFTSTRQEYRNGTAYGDKVTIEYTGSAQPDWINHVTGGDWSAQENKSTNSRTGTVTYTQTESGKKVTATFTQAAGVKTYGTPTVYLGTIADIPASGGTAATPTYTYTQLWGWNGKTSDGGTLDSGASVVWSDNISGSNLGTTAKARTKLGSRTLTVTLNGKSGSASIDIYQAQNQIENTTQGAWVVSISANPSTFTEQGGTSQITASASASRTNHWSSGATSAAANATGTPTLSIPTPSTGFSLSGTTLTVAENTTANTRSVKVRATMDTVYKEVTVTQSAYLVEWEYTFTATPTTLNFDALGTAKSITITSYREKYINGSLVDGSRENVSYIHATSTEHIGNVLGTSISMQENETTSSRTGQVSYEQNDSGKVIRITCNQAAGTISESWVLREISGFDTIPAVGGQVSAVVESGYYDVINGSQRTWHNAAPEVGSQPGWISLTSIQYNNNDTYTVKVTGISNGSESGRSGNISVTNSSKNLALSIIQSGASISYNYQFEVTTDFPSVAAAGTTPKAVIKSRRYKVVNGVQESSYTLVDLSVYSKPDWTGVLSVATSSSSGSGADKDVTLPVYENTSASIRRGTVVLQQSGSNKQITLNINQAAASITYQYTFEITDPSSKVINVPAKPIDPEPFSVSSFKTKVVNGTVTSETTRVGVTVDAIDENWLEVSVGSMGEGKVTCLENRTSSIRSVTITLRQEESGNLDQIDINQAAADIQVTYDLRWALSDRGSIPEDHVNEYSLGTGGEADKLHLFLLCDKISKIGTEEISRTPVQTGLSNLTTAGPVYTNISGEPSALINDDGASNYLPALFPELKDYSGCYNVVIGSEQNLGLVQEEISMTFNKPVMDGDVEIGKVPTFLFYIDAVSYSQVMEYQFRGAGGAGAGSIYNVTVPAADGTGYFSIISFRVYTRNGVEFKREYLEPTFTAPTDVTIIKNGQNSDNSYDYALKVTDNPGEIERQWDIPFVNPVTGSQIHLYLTQESPLVEYLTAELGNYYSYGDSNLVKMGFAWSSNYGGDSTGSGGMDTPGGYLGARIDLPALNETIDMSAIGIPSFGKPLKIKLANIRRVKDGGYGGQDTYTGLSVGYSNQDYQLGIVMADGMSNYFTLTPNILSSGGEYGGGIQIQVTYRTTYPGYQGDSIADITLTPKDSNLPTLYLNIAYGNP